MKKEINLMAGRNLYFLIGSRRTPVGSNTFVTTALPPPELAVVGDEIQVENFKMKVLGIEEERPLGAKGEIYKDHIFQRLNCEVTKVLNKSN